MESTTQENITQEVEVLNNSNVIRNISFDQSEILWNIMKLYNNGEAFECDMTASQLKFYGKLKNRKYNIPEPKILFDVNPLQDKIIRIEPNGKLPLKDNSVSSIVVDLPFIVSPQTSASVLNPQKNRNMIYSRFSSYYPAKELYISYLHYVKEAYRVLKPNGILVWKTQSTISGGINHSSVEWSFMCMHKAGFYIEDEFILQAKSRLISSSKIKKQMHARKFTSTFFVARKVDKQKANMFNYFDLMDELDKQETNV
jgi:hypothetical protein